VDSEGLGLALVGSENGGLRDRVQDPLRPLFVGALTGFGGDGGVAEGGVVRRRDLVLRSSAHGAIMHSVSMKTSATDARRI